MAENIAQNPVLLFRHESISLEKHGSVLVLRLLGPGGHYLYLSTVEAIFSALDCVERLDAAALVTTNEGDYFCLGMDLAGFKADGKKGAAFWFSQCELLAAKLMRLPMPTIAAIRGHAIGSGFVLALAHDHRFMRKDKGFLQLNEVINSTSLLPCPTMELIRRKMSPPVFKDALLKGVRYTGEMAASAGLVDSAHDGSAQTMEAAWTEAYKLGSRRLERSFYSRFRLDMYPGLVEMLESDEYDRSPRDGLLSRL